MNRSTHLVISATCFALLILLLKCSTPASAGPCLVGYNTGGECICIPNAKNFGYFVTTWRQWPDERRPHEDFPQSIGLERLPTPKGHEQLPVPMETELPGIAPPSEEGILPPGGFQIDEATPEEPILPDALPMLPEEPTDLLPGETFEEERPETPVLPDILPGLPLDADTQPQPNPTDDNLTPEEEEINDENDGVELSKPAAEPFVAKPAEGKKKVRALQANWMAALHPGFRGDTHRGKTVYPSTQSPESEIVLQGEIKLRAATSSDLDQSDAQPAGHFEETQPAKDQPPMLDGYCPVELIDNERWIKGKPQWSAIHHGRTYQFSGSDQRQRFFGDTEHYCPACDGCDPVLTAEGDSRVAGLTKHCIIYKGRLYMFSSPDTLQQFHTNPKRYVR